MKVLVLGTGVIGVTTAYELAGAGHEVTVVDRQPAPALETSFANAGEVSPGYSAPWAGPGVPLKAIKWLLMHHRPLVIRPHIDLALDRAGCWRCCATARRRATRSTRRAWCASPNTAATACARCAPTPASPTTSACRARCSCSARRSSSTAAPSDIAVLRASGVAFELLDRAGCIRHEPALAAVRDKFVGGLLPAGRRDRRLLQVHAGAGEARRGGAGVDFRFGTAIRGLVRSGARLDGVATDAGTLAADAYLVALGSYSPLLLDAARHAHSGLSGQGLLDHGADHRRRRRARIDGDGRDPQGRGHAARRPHPRRRHGRARRLHAEAARGAARDAGARRRATCSRAAATSSRAEFWCGLRPMTPDGTPVIGADAARQPAISPPATARSAGPWPPAPAG